MRVTTVLGSPGTGKTQKLVSMVKDSKNNGYKNKDIQIISHTKAAAGEINDRAGKGVEASTIHSLAFAMCGMVATQVVNNSMLKNFSEEVGINIRGVGDLDSYETLNEGDEYLALYNYSRNIKKSADHVYSMSHRPGNYNNFQYFYKSYDNWKKAYGLMDFTDMLVAGAKSTKGHGIKVLYIDEAQDLSFLQWDIVHKLMEGGVEEVILAGDPDQSLYVWGGADPNGMRDFIDRYNSEVITLEQSYRVPKLIHRIGQRIIKRIDERIEKTYFPRDEDGVFEEYGSPHYLDFDPSEDTLVLFRNHSMRKELERELINGNTPYETIGGFQGLFQNKYAEAIRSLEKLRCGKTITKFEVSRMASIAFDKYKAPIMKMNFKEVINCDLFNLFDIPSWMCDYYSGVELTKTPKIKLSTIHGSKGKEADHIVLFTGMTNRTSEEMYKNPDNEHRVWYVGVTRTKQKLSVVHGENGYDI